MPLFSGILMSLVSPSFAVYHIALNKFESVFGFGNKAGLVLSIGILSCSAASIVSCYRFAFTRWSMLSIAMKFGGHLAVLRFIERYIEDSEDATNTLSILQTMTCTDEHMTDIAAKVGCIEITVKALKRFSEKSETVACSGCGLLMNISGRSLAIDKRIMESGGINVLVQAMQQWPQNELVQTYACTALDRLADSPSSAIIMKIIDVGGLVALAEARTRHQHDARVVRPAAHALVELVQHKSKCIDFN